MLILDFNQVALSCIAQESITHNGLTFDKNLVRHYIMNAIRAHNKRFGPKFGELVIACDGKNYWRKHYFEYYKAGRKKGRDESPLDWNMIFETFQEIRDAIQEYFPVKLIHLDGIEADDIIAVLTKRKSVSPNTPVLDDLFGEVVQNKSTMIVSGDKDFQQLQKFGTVYQYSPTLKKDLICKNPKNHLLEHILRGDKGDGVPNMLSPDDVFVSETGSRQPSITAPLVETWLSYADRTEEFFNDFADGKILPNLKRKISATNLRTNYDRNNLMINLEMIPEQVQARIIEEYEKPITGSLAGVMQYFSHARLRNLLENVGDFKSYK